MQRRLNVVGVRQALIGMICNAHKHNYLATYN